MAQYRTNCIISDNCTDCEYRGEHGCLAPRIVNLQTDFVSNKALADEIGKRMSMVDEAIQNIRDYNYGVAVHILRNVTQGLNIKVIDIEV